MDKTTVQVHTPFTLTHDNGSVEHFGVGKHEIEAGLAEHWYVRLHTGDKPGSQLESGGAGGGAEMSAELRTELDRASAELRAEAEQIDSERATLNGREAALKQLANDLDEREKALDARQAGLNAREVAIAEAAAATRGDPQQPPVQDGGSQPPKKSQPKQ
ncbi:STY1053 family phage-associated protein [Paraburkholderia dioscoreae]|uniref:Uncharacterized protein n=1 Tax=Paraburkholderia dioscoreae TaxID=2604047 RepID=A0A5Q4Z740_9BURK|nr:hypothetical protein [Paraburkholderia dioscoreae]VVD29165.1 conserved protein of unknown function [Paraburkholderia dioscoreae]